MLDTLIQKEYIQPMIIVCPSAINSYDGSWYTNSIVTGQWEDFIVQDVVAHIDATYRTLPSAGSRGIAGHSMGAYGAMKIAMKHPDVFCSVYSMSGGSASLETILETRKDFFLQCMQMTYYNRFEPHPWLRIPIAMVVAMAPNPSMEPFMGEFPYNEHGNPVDSIWQKWLTHDPVSLLDKYYNSVKQLKAIRFDCGTNDEAILSNSILSETLTLNEIEHVFETYSGDHMNMIVIRIAEELLPFFSQQLDHGTN
jgi:S-formylglutathione hydrolase FrmB